ncbi:MAG TPA: hypothetical protein VFQ68_40475 [Streptosporangiaceae bacterium]|nr:hypothetical protein [Streptosporangiaceae bacterium]
MLPGWARRRPRVAAAAAAVLAGALAAGIIVAVTPSPPPGPRYTSLPAHSCGMISPAHLAASLPGATGTQESVVSGVSAALVKIDACKWSSRSGGTDQTLLAEAFVFGTKTALANAERSYRGNLPGTGAACHCARVAVTSQPVAGLGDKAEELYVAPRPDANFVDAPIAASPGTTLLVLSSNAFIGINLDSTAAASGDFLASPPGAAQLAGLAAMARDILAALARPSSVPAPAAAAVTPQAHYADRRDPCRLISTAAVARYAPAAILQPLPDTGTGGLPQRSECDWNADDGTSVALTLQLSLGVDGAQAAFHADVGTIGVTVTGVRAIPDLGDGAVASYTIEPGSAHVQLYVLSGNAELEYAYTVKGSGPPRLDRSSPLAGVITMAREGLAALGRPAASRYQQGPRYSVSQPACSLIRSATLARYGIGSSGESDHGVPGESLCSWGSDSVSVTLIVSVESDPDSALGSYEFDTRASRKNEDGFTFTGAQPVADVGQQAQAVFQKLNGSPSVTLYVWSGNAELNIGATDLGLSFGVPLSRAAKLAADIAMARDVLARLHRA